MDRVVLDFSSTPYDCSREYDAVHMTRRNGRVHEASGSFGGVSQISAEAMKRTHGYSNYFYGWGGEDDDFMYRLQETNSSVKQLHEWRDNFEFQSCHGIEDIQKSQVFFRFIFIFVSHKNMKI